MRVALFVGLDPARTVEQAREAETLGFDGVASGEHVFFHGPVGNCFITLAAAAGATSRVRLISSLTVLPVYPAALAVKLATTLDQVSGGRFELGVGVGGEYPPEFAAVGVDPAERGARTDEALELARRLWAGGPVSFDGRFTTVPDLELQPGPVHAGGPPVWVGGRSPAPFGGRAASPTSGCRTCTRPSSWPGAWWTSGRRPSGPAGIRPPCAGRSCAGARSARTVRRPAGCDPRRRRRLPAGFLPARGPLPAQRYARRRRRAGGRVQRRRRRLADLRAGGALAGRASSHSSPGTSCRTCSGGQPCTGEDVPARPAVRPQARRTVLGLSGAPEALLRVSGTRRPALRGADSRATVRAVLLPHPAADSGPGEVPHGRAGFA